MRQTIKLKLAYQKGHCFPEEKKISSVTKDCGEFTKVKVIPKKTFFVTATPDEIWEQRQKVRRWAARYGQ